MAPSIDISDKLFKQLEARAIGFDTPEMVIQRLLGEAEGKPEKKPEIVFCPVEEVEFKKQLLLSREVEITIHKSDETREIIHWHANRFKENSNLRANIWSGYLRGWKEKGITKAELFILPQGTSAIDDDTFQIKKIALEIGLKYSELEEISHLYEIHTNESDDGLIYNYRIEFSDECPIEILNKIPSLDGDRWIELDVNIFDTPENHE